MKHPAWYSEWRHEAVHQLQTKNAALSEEFRLGHWPRYDYDLDTGRLIFSDPDGPKVIAEIQVVGTTSVKAGNWLWAWGNAHWPVGMTEDSLLTRDFGEQHSIKELVDDYVDGDELNALGWELTAVCARVSNAIGAYRPPRDEGGALFLLYRTVNWAN
jgi:hypothetical protein